MDGELHQRRATSFGAVAASYTEHRPGYPQDAVGWALQRAPGTTVLDLGAGTGKLTEALLRTGSDVVAVEPDTAMLAELRSRLPSVEALEGSAESIPLPDASVDAVLVGQAFHWFDPGRALPELARVLRDRGVFAVVANAEDEAVPWVSGFLAAIRAQRRPGLASAGRDAAATPEHPSLRSREERTFRWSWDRTVDAAVGTIATHSWALLTPPAERAAALAAIRAHLLTQHPDGVFVLPMTTTVVRTQRTLRS